MQVLSDGRIRRTAPEWKEIIDRFGKIGLPIAEFCQKEEISRSAFASWKKKLGNAPRSTVHNKKTPSFIPLLTFMVYRLLCSNSVRLNCLFNNDMFRFSLRAAHAAEFRIWQTVFALCSNFC